jgi:transcriptional regulator with XRE-family HTH domain
MPRRKIDWYGPRLRELREQIGLSQAELGERVELAGSQINKLETNVNQPTLATALVIAEALGVSLTSFIPPAAGRFIGTAASGVRSATKKSTPRRRSRREAAKEDGP